MSASDLIWIDGFDTYGTVTASGNTLAQRYSTSAVTLVTGRFGGLAVNTSNGNSTIGANIPAGSTFAMGFAHRANSLPASGTPAGIVFFQTSATVQACMTVGSDGSLTIGRQDTTTNALATSAAGVIIVGVWNFIEIELVIHDTTGSFKVWVNGAQVISVTNVDTKGQASATADNFRFFPSSNVSGQDLDDLYICSTASRLGECRVETIRPNADTAQKDWTPSTGTNNSALVDETTSNGDTDYVSSSTVGHIDLYDMSDLSAVPATVLAVQTVVTAKKDDVGTREIRSKVKSGATTGNGATKTLAGSHATYRDIFVNNPATSAPFTGAEVQSVQVGIEVVT